MTEPPDPWWTIPESELLQALIEAHAGIQPATVLARLKYEAQRDTDPNPHPEGP